MAEPIGMNYTREGSQENARMMSRYLTPDKTSTSSNKPGGKTTLKIDQQQLDQKIAASVQNRMDASAMMQMLPDIELSKRILIGLILSPKDLYSTEVGFTADAERFGPEITRDLLDLIRLYIVDKFKINDRLETMLERALFTEGAYPLLILPENNLDRLINRELKYNPGMEAYARTMFKKRVDVPLGFLGIEEGSMEAFEKGSERRVLEVAPFVDVTDNFSVLKESRFDKALRSSQIQEKFSQESANVGMTENEINELYNKPLTPTADSQVEVIDNFNTTRKNRGCPLVELPPASAVIPVCQPGRPEQHEGYFIMLTDKGTYVTGEESRNYHEEIRTRYNSAGKDESTNTTRRVQDAMGFKDEQFKASSVDERSNAFAPLIEHKLKELLRNGMYQEELDFDFTQNVKRIMYQRAVAGRRTRILFVPKELMSYVAFDYNDNGIGQSLLAKTAIIGSMRMALALAHNMGQLRNAIARRKVRISFDDDEVDPMKTINDVQTMILEQAVKSYPLAASDPVGMMRALQLSAYDFAYDGSAPGLPKTKVDFEDWSTQDQGGNPEYAAELRQQQAMGFGLNSEIIDPTQAPNFAIEAVQNDVMMTKNVRHRQRQFLTHLTGFSRAFCKFSGDFKRDAIKIIERHRSTVKKEFEQSTMAEFIDAFLDTLELTLPSPDRSRISEQTTAYNDYKGLLEETLNAFVSTEIIPDAMLGDNPKGTVDQAIAILKAKFLRDWMAENDVMPELAEILELGDDDRPNYDIYEIQEPLVTGLVKAMKQYLDKTMPDAPGGFDGGGMGGDSAGGDMDGSGDLDGEGNSDDDEFGDFSDDLDGGDGDTEEPADDEDEGEPEEGQDDLSESEPEESEDDPEADV